MHHTHYLIKFFIKCAKQKFKKSISAELPPDSRLSMGVREDFVCDDSKTVPVPHLNKLMDEYYKYEYKIMNMHEYEEINCAGYDINGYLKIPGLAKCKPSYKCSRWNTQEYHGIHGIGYWEETSCSLSSGVFSHCSQCNMCTSIEDAQIKVRK